MSFFHYVRAVMRLPKPPVLYAILGEWVQLFSTLVLSLEIIFRGTSRGVSADTQVLLAAGAFCRVMSPEYNWFLQGGQVFLYLLVLVAFYLRPNTEGRWMPWLCKWYVAVPLCLVVARWLAPDKFHAAVTICFDFYSIFPQCYMSVVIMKTPFVWVKPPHRRPQGPPSCLGIEDRFTWGLIVARLLRTATWVGLTNQSPLDAGIHAMPLYLTDSCAATYLFMMVTSKYTVNTLFRSAEAICEWLGIDDPDNRDDDEEEEELSNELPPGMSRPSGKGTESVNTENSSSREGGELRERKSGAVKGKDDKETKT